MAKKPGATSITQEPAGYGELLEDLKSRIRSAQVRAAVAVNRELIGLYWDIGRAIVERQQREEWGSAVIERLSRDLRAAFPEVQGFSPRNLWRMRALYVAYCDPALLPQPAEPASTDGRSVILPQAVAEMHEANSTAAEIEASEAADPHSVFLAQMLGDIGDAAAAAGRSVFLSQAVAEIGEQGTADARSVILSQAVAELGEAETASHHGNALPQLVAELPWGHNVVLLEKVSTTAERLWYAEMAARHGWSRNVLLHQIETGLQTRSGTAVTNFDRTLPAPHSDLARELLKDPYHFEFLQLGAEVLERDVERALLANVRDFLMELGVGFALVGSQYHLEVGGQDYYLDLLFFHVRLRRYVVVELKVGAFQPEDAGKMNFYLAAVDDLVREEGHEPSIGLILCKEHNRVVAEYALRFTGKPIGIAEFRLLGELPATLRGNLPSVEELEKRLDRDDGFER
jgi:predicted nuclease of restriction endonuclease-like (RecB) superfamily